MATASSALSQFSVVSEVSLVNLTDVALYTIDNSTEPHTYAHVFIDYSRALTGISSSHTVGFKIETFVTTGSTWFNIAPLDFYINTTATPSGAGLPANTRLMYTADADYDSHVSLGRMFGISENYDPAISYGGGTLLRGFRIFPNERLVAFANFGVTVTSAVVGVKVIKFKPG